MQVSLVREPFERVAVDITVTGPHPKSSRGNKFILAMVDYFSIFTTAVGLSNRRTIGMEPFADLVSIVRSVIDSQCSLFLRSYVIVTQHTDCHFII